VTGSVQIDVGFRPLRIAWCIRSSSWEDFRQALRLTHTLWGGRFNPIIPISDGDQTFARSLIEFYRVDLMQPVTDQEMLHAFINSVPHRQVRYREEIYADRRYPTFLDISHPIRRIYEMKLDEGERRRLRATHVRWEEGDPLGDLFLTTFGDFPHPEGRQPDYAGMFAALVPSRRLILPDEVVPADSLGYYTPNALTGFDLKGGDAPELFPSGFYVGDARRLDNLIHFWNLRAAGLDLVFYDPSRADRFTELRDRRRSGLEKRPNLRSGFNPRIAVWYDPVEGDIDTDAFGKNLALSAVSAATWNGLNLSASNPHFGSKTVLGTLSDRDGRVRVTFALPESPVGRSDNDSDWQRLVVTARVYTDATDDDTTFQVPNLPTLHPFLTQYLHLGGTDVRVSRFEVGLIEKVRTESLTLRGLDRRDLIKEVFATAGIEASPSQAGLVGSRLIHQMGGLQGCRVFKIAGVRALIEAYSPFQSFTRSAAIQRIRSVDPSTGISQFTRYEGLFLEPRDGGKLRSEDAFRYLVRQDVFRVGLRFVCPRCELDFWTPLDSARTQMECEYCGNPFNVADQLRDRDWAYRRSGLFGREDNQEGGIAVALTLQQLHATLDDRWIAYTNALSLRGAGIISDCETDFAVLSQTIGGEVELLIGETKTRKEISAADVENLTRVADALQNNGIRPYIVFSKLADFTDAELQRFQEVQDCHAPRLILLTPRELEPYAIYSEIAGELQRRPTILSAADMAAVSSEFYLSGLQSGHGKKNQ
jgi:hypothetical protein